MAGVPARSGGWNRRPLEDHLTRGSYRPDRHGHLKAAPPPEPVSSADRRRTLKGLTGGARRIVAALLDDFAGWDAARLETLRAYALSCERLAGLQDAPGDDTRTLHREIRSNLALLKALDLEG